MLTCSGPGTRMVRWQSACVREVFEDGPEDSTGELATADEPCYNTYWEDYGKRK